MEGAELDTGVSIRVVCAEGAPSRGTHIPLSRPPRTLDYVAQIRRTEFTKGRCRGTS